MPSRPASVPTGPAVLALCKREILKFVRDRSRLLGALAQPLGLWLLLGLGFQETFRMPAQTDASVGYMEFLFPGIIALVILFTAIFSTITIVEDRSSGFLQAALTAPSSRTALVLGTVLGGTILALIQGALFLLLLPFIGLGASIAGLLLALLTCLLTGITFTALGFLIAWNMQSTRGFHAVMNLFLLPLWFLSGSFFPAEGASRLLQWLMYLNPVSYSVSALRHALYWPDAAPATFAPLGLCLAVSAAFAAIMVGASVWKIRRPLF